MKLDDEFQGKVEGKKKDKTEIIDEVIEVKEEVTEVKEKIIKPEEEQILKQKIMRIVNGKLQIVDN